jgi:hypothetical protein
LTHIKKANLNKGNDIQKFPLVVKAMNDEEIKEYFLKRLYNLSLNWVAKKLEVVP